MELLKECLLLRKIVNKSNYTKCVSVRYLKCMIQPTLINLHRNEYSQELNYYPFAVKLDRCVVSCDTLTDLSNKVCLLNKTEDLTLFRAGFFGAADGWEGATHPPPPPNP